MDERKEKPSHREILNMFRDKVGDEEFEIMVKEMLPSFEQLHQEGCVLRYLGKTVSGYYVWVKRSWLGFIVAAIVSTCDKYESFEKVCHYGPIVFEQVAGLIQMGQNNCSKAAEGFVIAYPRMDATLPPAPPFAIVRDAVKFSSSSSSSSSSSGLDIFVPPGAELVPYSDQWT